MLRYKNVPSIEFEIGNDYEVKAEYIHNRDINKYYVSLHIRHRLISQWNLMEKFEDVEFESDKTTIKFDIAKYVTDLLTDGSFKYCIDRTEYEMKCFDRGNELFEQERLTLNTESQVGENV